MISGTESVALCHVCAKESVTCAIMRGTGYVHNEDNHYGIRLYKYLYLTLSLLFLFLWHRKKESLYTRAHKKGYIGVVPGERVLCLIKGSVSYT